MRDNAPSHVSDKAKVYMKYLKNEGMKGLASL